MKNFFQFGLIAALFLSLLAPAQAEQARTKKSGVAKKTIQHSPWSRSYQLEKKGKYAQAAEVISPFRTRGTDQELANMRTAWLEYLQGNYNRAVSGYQAILKKNPHSIDGHLGIALPMMAQKRWREAKHYLSLLLKFAPWHYTAHVRLMSIEESQRKWKKLAAHAKVMSLRYPNDATTLVYLARAYAWQARKTQAKNTYARVLIRIPGHLEATSYLKNNR
jgi:tetratricopeptide (TPR) repeat protein